MSVARRLRVVAAILGLVMGSAFVPHVAAQTNVSVDSLAGASAPQQPRSGERSPLAAALLQAALPPLPLGYLYAGDVARGLIPTGLMIVGSTLFLVEAVEVLDWTTENESEGLLYLGLVATAGGYVFGIVDAANVARRRNERLRVGGASLGLIPAPRGVAVAVSIPVD